MLLGMARQLRQRLNVPIVCSLSGEDVFLEGIEMHVTGTRIGRIVQQQIDEPADLHRRHGRPAEVMNGPRTEASGERVARAAPAAAEPSLEAVESCHAEVLTAGEGEATPMSGATHGSCKR